MEGGSRRTLLIFGWLRREALPPYTPTLRLLIFGYKHEETTKNNRA